MNAVHVITRDGRDAVAALEPGKRGGTVLTVRGPYYAVLLAAPVDHVTPTMLGTIVDPGTAQTILTLIGA